jgi:hypothetical protein
MDWVAIDSQRSDLRAVPTKACFFNTSTNHFCCINVWGPGTTHCSQACQNRKSISVVLGGTLDFLLQKQPPWTFQNPRNSGSRYFNSSRTARFHQRTSGYLTFSNVFCGQWVMYQKNWVSGVFWEPRLGAWRTAVISGSGLFAGSNTRPPMIYIHLGVLGDCIFFNPGVGAAFCFPLVFVHHCCSKRPIITFTKCFSVLLRVHGAYMSPRENYHLPGNLFSFFPSEAS